MLPRLDHSPADYLFAVEALAELAWTDLRLRLLPYRRWRAGVTRAAAWPSEDAGEQRRVHRLSRLFTAVTRRYPRHTTCLVRALCLHRLLARRGIDTTLRIGVKRAEGPLGAHAWLEQGRRAVYGGPGDHVTLEGP